jgi:hypothetical protein
MLCAFKGAHTLFTGQIERVRSRKRKREGERERGRESERERESDVEYVQHYFFKE